MAMIGVFAEAHVGDDDEIGRGVLNGADGAWNDRRLSLKLSLPRQSLHFGDAEEDHGGNAQLGDFFGFRRQLDRPSVAKSPGMDLIGICWSRPWRDEERIDEVVRRRASVSRVIRRIAERKPQTTRADI